MMEDLDDPRRATDDIVPVSVQFCEFVPAEGRSVVYQIAEGEWRPAQIVRVWQLDGRKTCNLVVFVDGGNDRGKTMIGETPGLSCAPLIWKTSVYLGDAVGEYLPRKP